MDFIISKTSNVRYFNIQHFNTLQDLTDFLDDRGEDIIIKQADITYYLSDPDDITTGFSKDQIKNCNYELEIYDDWRE